MTPTEQAESLLKIMEDEHKSQNRTDKWFLFWTILVSLIVVGSIFIDIWVYLDQTKIVKGNQTTYDTLYNHLIPTKLTPTPIPKSNVI